MSDYEGEGGGWNRIDLPIRHDPARASASSLTEQVAPKGLTLPDEVARNDSRPRRERTSLHPRSIKRFEPLLQKINPRAHHNTGGRPVEPAFQPAFDHQDLPSFKLFQQNPEKPSDVYELDIAWKGLLKAIPDTADYRARDIARNHLNIISAHSEAFLKTPEPDSLRIEIWGDAEHCKIAKTRLHAWEGHLRSTGTRPSQKTWYKGQAFDGRREDRKRQEQWQELGKQALMDADDSDFEYEAYLVWPSGFDLEAYLKKYESGTLAAISDAFACRFRHERKARPRITKVQAQTEDELLSAYQRLINLVKEMIAQKNKGTHGNFCRLPSSKAYSDQVLVEKVTDATTAPYIATLVRDDTAESGTAEWDEWSKIYQKQNRAEIQASVDSFLQALYLSQCYISMRVSFGDLLLKKFIKAKGGTLQFPFDEFLVMLQSSRTEFSEPVLRDPRGDILDRLLAMEQLHPLGEAYRQIFEFKGSDSTNRLRLDIEMIPGYDFEEPQVRSQRWLTFKVYSQNENVLGLRMFDFERPGYMIRADAYDRFTNDNIIRDMEAFRSAVRFKPSPDGIRGYPRLRSTFPSHDKLVAVTEFTATKFRFKDTDGIIELRREDVYLQDAGKPRKLPDSTRFELCYYYPEWDNLLGEFSDIKAGEDISWVRGLKTFFPDHIDPDRPRSLPKGFKTFMKELLEIQDLLKEALSTPPSASEAMNSVKPQH